MTDAIQARITGTVARTGSASTGPYADVEVKREGSLYPDRVTVWGLDATTGDRVIVRGNLSWRKSEKDGKTYFNVSLNKPVVEKHEPAAGPIPATYVDESPF
jgi:hypothetical protein